MDGVLVVAKPAGPTSHDVVGLLRRLSATRRVGHGGTLDPFATGVLPVFLGRATRLAEYHVAAGKGYRATVCFGAASTTDDLEGELTPVIGAEVRRAAVEAALASFRGPLSQQPPAYSAVKVRGRRAYAMARRGETPELPVRQVTIHELVLREWDATDPSRPIAVLDVECSAGTYVRALARDIGRSVGSAAYLGALVRTYSGPFRIEDAHTLDEVRAAASSEPPRLQSLLLPLDAGLGEFPEASLDEPAIAALARGQQVRAPEGVPTGTPVRVRDPGGRLVAIATRVGDQLRPGKVLVDVGD